MRGERGKNAPARHWSSGDIISECLGDSSESAAGNMAKPAREQLTLIRLFEELRGRGCDGGYDAVLHRRLHVAAPAGALEGPRHKLAASALMVSGRRARPPKNHRRNAMRY
jgi:hypothetical protein